MAKAQLAEEVPMRLCLQEADPGVELGHDVDVLVVGGKDADES